MITFFTQLVLKNYYAISKRPQSTLGVFCQFYLFYFNVTSHIGHHQPCVILLCLKNPLSSSSKQDFFHRPHLLAQDYILLDIQGHSWWHEPYAT